MKLYEGPATLVVGDGEFAIYISVDEKQDRVDVSASGTGRASVAGLKQWTASYSLIDPEQEMRLFTAQIANREIDIIRIPDGREAKGMLKDGWFLGSGDWPANDAAR